MKSTKIWLKCSMRTVCLIASLLLASPVDAFLYHGQEREITDELTLLVGDCFFMKVPKVLYETSNHDVCELLLSTDTEPTKILFTKPGEAVITCTVFNEDGSLAQHHVLIHAVESGDVSNTETEKTRNVEYPNVFPKGFYNGKIGGSDPGDVAGIVPLSELANYDQLHWNLTDEQLSACYEAAKPFVATLVGLSQEEQMKRIAQELRDFFDNRMEYSDKAPHFLDAYGFFINKKASCQGATCAVGLCLNMLGIDYEHVNHNKWTHQWCRVSYNGAYWIVDPYGLYCGPEPAPYKHPMDDMEK